MFKFVDLHRTCLVCAALCVPQFLWAQEGENKAAESSPAAAPAAAKTEATPAETPVEVKTPVPEVKPTEVPAVVPEVTPATPPAAEKKKKKKDAAPAKTEKEAPVKPSYHAATPAELADKLSVGLGVSIGVGNKAKFSSDLFGFYTGISYKIMPIPVLEGLSIIGSARLNAHTGMLTKDDLSYVAQTYLFGFGASYQPSNLPLWTFSGNALIGFQRLLNWKSSDLLLNKAEYGFASGMNMHVAFTVFEKVDVIAGCTMIMSKDNWYGFDLGTSARF